MVSNLQLIVAAQHNKTVRLEGLRGRLSVEPLGLEKVTKPKSGCERGKAVWTESLACVFERLSNRGAFESLRDR